jgi:hypothetical protein
MSMYCDLAINGNPVWYGRLCLNLNGLNWYRYMGFYGQLLFVDTQESSDPDYTELGTRYVLVYAVTGADAVTIPIQAVPSQQLDVILNNQLCTISLYTK